MQQRDFFQEIRLALNLLFVRMLVPEHLDSSEIATQCQAKTFDFCVDKLTAGHLICFCHRHFKIAN